MHPLCKEPESRNRKQHVTGSENRIQETCNGYSISSTIGALRIQTDGIQHSTSNQQQARKQAAAAWGMGKEGPGAGGVQKQPAASSVKHAACSLQQTCTQHASCSKRAHNMQQSCSKQCEECSMLHDMRIVLRFLIQCVSPGPALLPNANIVAGCCLRRHSSLGAGPSRLIVGLPVRSCSPDWWSNAMIEETPVVICSVNPA